MSKRISRRGIISMAGSATAASVAIPLLARNDGRLYGVPTSVSGPHDTDVVSDTLVRFPLTHLDMPTEIWNEALVASSLWNDVLSDAEEGMSFSADPGSYLLSRGVSPELLNDQHMEVQLLKAVTNPSVQRAAATRDYDAFSGRIRDVIDLHPTTGRLSEIVATHIEQNRESVERAMESIAQLSPDVSIDETEIGKLRRLQEIVDAPLQGTGLADTVALLNVYVFINFSIFSIGFLAVAIFIAASTFFLVTVAGSGAAPKPIGLDGALSDRLSALDPELVRNVEITVKAAKLLGQENFVKSALQETARLEATAVVEALEKVGLFTIDPSHRDEAFRLIGDLYLDSAGLAS